MSNPLTTAEMKFLNALAIEGFSPGKPASDSARAVGIGPFDWFYMSVIWQEYHDPNFCKAEFLEPDYVISNIPPCPWVNKEHYLRRAFEALRVADVPSHTLELFMMKLSREATSVRVAQPHLLPCPGETVKPNHGQVKD